MLVLFETPAGYALFKVHNEGKLQEANIAKDFATLEGAQKVYDSLLDFYCAVHSSVPFSLRRGPLLQIMDCGSFPAALASALPPSSIAESFIDDNFYPE